MQGKFKFHKLHVQPAICYDSKLMVTGMCCPLVTLKSYSISNEDQ